MKICKNNHQSTLLMADVGIKNYSQEAIEQLYEKLRLNHTDENAEIHFQDLLEESMNTLFSDKIHFQGMRK